MNVGTIAGAIAAAITVAAVAQAPSNQPPANRQAAANDPVYQAIRANDLAALGALATRGAIDAKGPAGLTPLVEAVAFGSADAVKLLVDAGANVQAASDNGLTPLHVAWRDAAVARLLLDRGAKVNAKTSVSATPLFVAASATGTANVVALLLDRGASVDEPDNRGVTPLIAAAAVGNADVARALIAHGANVNAHATQPSQKTDTPLMGAANNGDIELARILLARKSDVRATSADNDGTVKHGLVAYGALTVLHHAVASRNPDMVKLVLDAGASIDAADTRGMTPLAWAIASDRPEPRAIKLLLERGASTSVKTTDGESPMDWARKFNDPAVMQLLKLAPARVDSAVTHTSAALSARAALDQGVRMLRVGAAGTMNEGGCVACHSHPIAAIAINLTAARGWADLAPADTADVVKANRDGLTNYLNGREGGGQPDAQEYDGFMMAELKMPPTPHTDALVYWLAAKQRQAGNWHGLVTRAPIQDGDVSATAMGIRILTTYGAPARKADYEDRVKRAAAWLAGETPRSTQERVMQILGMMWADPRADVRGRARELEALQAADGGWAQTPNLPTDAYGTGEALYALHEIGTPATSPAVRHGTQFLLQSQAPDGSWRAKSRAGKIQPYFESGFPYGGDQWISQAATAWAAAALALYAPADAAPIALMTREPTSGTPRSLRSR